MQPPPATTDTPSATPDNSNAKFETLLADPQIQYFLKQESLRIHLKSIFDILENSRLSNEHSAEGRRAVALKKLRELRVGGREANELVEEFVLRVLELLDPETEQ